MSHSIFRGLLQQAGGGGGGGGSGDPNAWLHYDASAITGVADGAALPYTSLLDQSGNGRHAVAVGYGVTSPTYAANGFGSGKPAIRFPGLGSYQLPSMAALTEMEMFAVFVRDSDPIADNAYGPIWELGANGAPLCPANDGNVYDDSGSSTYKNIGNPTPLFTTARLVNVISTSTEWTFNLDTTQLYTTATNTVAFPASSSVTRLGGAGGASTFPGFIGYLAEFRIYATKRSSGQRSTIAAAVKTKWGLSGY